MALDPRTNWPAYFEVARDFDVRPTTRFALDRFAAEGKTGLAVDLGCGNGTDTIAILQAGFDVVGIDGAAEALAELAAREDTPHKERLTLHQQTLEAANLPKCLLLNASFVLPFCASDAFPDLWGAIVSALPAGGALPASFLALPIAGGLLATP